MFECFPCVCREPVFLSVKGSFQVQNGAKDICVFLPASRRSSPSRCALSRSSALRFFRAAASVSAIPVAAAAISRACETENGVLFVSSCFSICVSRAWLGKMIMCIEKAERKDSVLTSSSSCFNDATAATASPSPSPAVGDDAVPAAAAPEVFLDLRAAASRAASTASAASADSLSTSDCSRLAFSAAVRFPAFWYSQRSFSCRHVRVGTHLHHHHHSHGC